MAVVSVLAGSNRQNLLRIADWLAVAVAVTLPWSTTATGICIALWLIAALVTIDVGSLRRELSAAAALLPILLWALAAVGMLWADASWVERFAGLNKFHRLLLIPILFMQFRRSDNGKWVLYGFMASVVALVIVSWGLALIPGLPWRGKLVGVPTKDYIFQSANFLLCAFALLGSVGEAARARGWRWAVGFVAVAALFLANIFFVVGSRTAFVVAPVLLLLLGWREFGWKGFFGAGVLGVILGAVVWFGSPYLHERLVRSVQELQQYRASDAANSTSLHIEFMRKAVGFVETAPVFGHGTGSIPEQYREAVAGETGAASALSANPHNQILAVGIQLGLVGVAVLVAMWITHVLLFCGGGLNAWFGLLIVVQNIASSLFNSHLFDFTSGWLYVFGVGVIGGMVLREGTSARTSAARPVLVS
jgi:O-antigen ligase